MSIISHCVLILEVTDTDSILPTLFWTASKYPEIRGKKGKGERIQVTGSQSSIRGQRGTRTFAVETYFAPLLVPTPIAMSKVNSNATAAKPTATDTAETKDFVSGNPFVELTKGILHLHKDNELSSSNNAETPRSEMLCMLSVPSTIECRDLVQYVAPFQADLEHIKIIRDTLPNQYMALLKFKSQKAADSFYKENNGTPFNSFEEDICKLAYVSRVESMRASDFAGLPLSGHTELPTCPVCLERMDESVDGILTVLCNHTFHTNCLAKWSDSSCPVCRYVQTPEMVANNQCSECSSTESLWICLICGHVGCGRYVQGHAYKHFCETEHCYAIQPDNNRVWDYVGDTFVHRLIQNKGDGKLVEVSGNARHRNRNRRPHTQTLSSSEQVNPTTFSDDEDGNGDGEKDEDALNEEEKIDSMQLEFTHLLTNQLDTQRKYFEQKLGTFEQETKRNQDQLNERIAKLEEGQREREAKIQELQAENEQLLKNGLKVSKKLDSATSKLQHELTVNECLRKDRDKWMEIIRDNEDKIRKQESEVVDLKEQLRDIMAYLDVGDRIQKSGFKGELQDGTLSLPASSSSKGGGSSSTTSGAKGKRKN